VLNIIKSDVSTLRDRRTARNSKGNILQVLESSRELGVDQVGIESLVRNVGEGGDRQLLVVDSVGHNTEHARLGKTGACDGLRMSVQRQFAELQEVERTGCSCVLRLGVRDYTCETLDWTL
jgi:hypothetical protein